MTSYPVGNTISLSGKLCLAAKKFLWITIMKSWSLSKFYKKKQANINSKNLSFTNVVNGVSRSHKTANIFYHLTQ